MARASAYEIDGEVVPFSLEVRMKAAPCFHDAKPADHDPRIGWRWGELCDCWPPAWPGAEAVPPGGLPVRLLRQLKLTDLVARHRTAVETLEQYVGTEHPRPEVVDHFRSVLTRTGQPPTGRGRPSLEPAEHLRRLAALDTAYADGQTQRSAARRLKLSAAALRVSLEWGRRQDPPLWTRSGRGRPGRLTSAGQAAVRQLPTQSKRRTKTKEQRS